MGGPAWLASGSYGYHLRRHCSGLPTVLADARNADSALVVDTTTEPDALTFWRVEG